MKKIDTLIFDIGMVLIHYNYDEVVGQMGFSEEAVAALRAIKVEEKKYFKDVDRGLQTIEESLPEYMADAAPYGKEAAWALTNALRYIRPIGQNVRFLERAKKAGYRTLVLSNFDKIYWKYTRENMGFAHLLDGGVVSCDVGCVKPEREIYERLIGDWDVDVQTALFIDDRPANTKVAEDFGMATITLLPGMDLETEARAFGIELGE
ncbi:MAG: HAD-IA family hydrolase [Christensenellaceae bacterium]|nr:HAD-IA family hydrolase [Christensenellaceae bacterium]